MGRSGSSNGAAEVLSAVLWLAPDEAGVLEDAGVGVGVGVLDGAGVTGVLSVGRCNVGRSSELLDGDEPGAGVLDGAGVLLEAGVLEVGVLEVGVLEDDPLPAAR